MPENISDEVIIFAPDDVRDYRALPRPGETSEQTELANRMLHALLDRYGYRPIKS